MHKILISWTSSKWRISVLKSVSFSRVWLFSTPWTIAHQDPLSMEFSRQNSVVRCHPLLQGIFLTQGLNPCLLHYRGILYYLSHCSWKWSEVKVIQSCLTLCDPMEHGNLQARILEWVAGPFSRKSFQPRIKPRSPTLQADSLPAEPQGKPKNTGVGRLSLLQQIFPTQESNQSLLHCRHILYQLSYWGRPHSPKGTIKKKKNDKKKKTKP